MTPRRSTPAAAALAAAAWLSACGGTEPTQPPLQQGSLDADFEGGALESWTWTADEVFDLTLAKAPGGLAHYYSFRILDRAGLSTDFRVLDAQSATWENAWAVERPAVSEDGGATWRRVGDAEYTGFFYRFRYTPTTDDAWIATLPPYLFSRWLRRLDALAAARRPDVRVDTLATSLDGRPVHHVVIGEPERLDRPSIWILARQHADEMPGSWMAEGLLDWLLGASPEAAALRGAVTVHLVPFINPDGAVRGYQRLNTAGLDLNRVWDAPDPATAPTVASVREAVRADDGDGSPVVLFLDLHGDPGNRKNYGYGHGRDAAETSATRSMMAAVEEASDLFSADHSEIIDIHPNFAMGWAAAQLGTVAYTFEGSHLDIVHGPHAGRFMGPEEWTALGVALGRAVASLDHTGAAPALAEVPENRSAGGSGRQFPGRNRHRPSR